MNKAVEISETTAIEMIGREALLVDVREADEVALASFDVPCIMLIPFSEFQARFREIPADREVIVGCNVGERSLMATLFLMNNGYDKVFNLENGIVGWAEKGLPVKGELKHKTGGCCCGGNTGGNGKSCC
jgi:rhodanese-related sulfurtransferase